MASSALPFSAAAFADLRSSGLPACRVAANRTMHMAAEKTLIMTAPFSMALFSPAPLFKRSAGRTAGGISQVAVSEHKRHVRFASVEQPWPAEGDRSSWCPNLLWLRQVQTLRPLNRGG